MQSVVDLYLLCGTQAYTHYCPV